MELTQIFHADPNKNPIETSNVNPLPAAAVPVAPIPANPTLTIANGNSLSGATADLAGMGAIALLVPGTWDAANCTFQRSYDGTNFFDLYNADGTPYTLTVPALAAATPRDYPLDPSVFVSCRYIKVRSGTPAAPINQTATRTLTLVTRPL